MAVLTQADLSKLRSDIVFNTTLKGHSMEFHSTWGIFSPREIDKGTQLLLDHIEIDRSDTCIDLGCGYGPLGLAMAAEADLGRVHLIDKDFVAIDYT